MKIIKSTLLFITGCLIVAGFLFVTITLILHEKGRHYFELYKIEMEKYVLSETELQNQIRTLQGSWSQVPIGRKANIGSKLGGQIRWTSFDKSKVTSPGELKRWVKDEKIFVSLGSYIPHWFEERANVWSRVNAANLDFSWMKELHKYDHWDLFSTEFRRSLQLPIMDDFYVWSAARLLKGIEENDLKPALDEVSELAFLLISTEEAKVAGGVDVLFTLQTEAVATYLQTHPKAPWLQNLPISSIPNLIPVIKKGGRLIDIATPKGLIYDLYIAKGLVPSACTEIDQRYPILVIEKVLLGSKYPDEMAEVDQLVEYAFKGCRLHFRKDWLNVNFVPGILQQKYFYLSKLVVDDSFVNFIYLTLSPIANKLFGQPDSLPGIFKVFPDLKVIVGVGLATTFQLKGSTTNSH